MNDKEKIQESLRIINDLVELSSSILRECDKNPDKNDLAIKYLLNQNQLLEKLHKILE
jgi:hypothetical protein